MMIFLSTGSSTTIFDFNKSSSLRNWVVVDDVVMGGRSSGTFRLSEDGHGVFEGSVSLENNGGFSSVQHRFKRMNLGDHSKVVLKIKGDGKNYQFRVKANSRDYYSYVATFSTTGEWQEIEIPLEDMYPSFRGRKLRMSNFSDDHIEEIAILISNKKKENFQLVIDSIVLK